MKNYKMVLTLLGTLCALVLSGQTVSSQQKAAPSTVQVHLVITDVALRAENELPPLQREDVKVKQGKNFPKVTQFQRCSEFHG